MYTNLHKIYTGLHEFYGILVSFKHWECTMGIVDERCLSILFIKGD